MLGRRGSNIVEIEDHESLVFVAVTRGNACHKHIAAMQVAVGVDATVHIQLLPILFDRPARMQVHLLDEPSRVDDAP